jgi:hypothetical protein
VWTPLIFHRTFASNHHPREGGKPATSRAVFIGKTFASVAVVKLFALCASHFSLNGKEK